MAKKATNGITHETIIRDIQAGNIAPVYYLMGEEPYYIERLAAFISESVVKPEERDFNLTGGCPDCDRKCRPVSVIYFCIPQVS